MSTRLAPPVMFASASIAFLLAPGCTAPPATRPASADSGRRPYVSPGMVGPNAATDRRRELYDSLNERILREGVRVGTVVIGGSNMQRWNLADYFTPSDGTIENRGIGGEPAWHTARRFDADVVQLRPRNVVIHIPLNGISGMLNDGKSNDEIARTIADSITSMMKAGRAAGIHVLVLSMLPTSERYRLHRQVAPIQAIVNEKIRAACAANGCAYVDVTRALTDAGGCLRADLTRDGLHLNAEGYAILARVLKDAARARGWSL
ncbi:MAG: SGNH/GDSL hydrolase family protein [Phycisphaerae bacterium]